MNNRQFIAKQRVKYLWKSLKRTDRITGVESADVDSKELFWDFELIPREV